jgi:glycosyltransferase involved in cell wall biosynthesis
VNLLFLTPQLPYPPRQGTALRNWGLIRGLAQRHTVTLLSFEEEGQSVEEPLRAVCKLIRTVPTPERELSDRLRTIAFTDDADMARRLASDRFRQALREVLAADGFDAVHVEGIELARYIPEIKYALQARGGLVIYDAHNAEALLQQRAYETDRQSLARLPGALYSRIQAGRLERFEAWTLQQADRVLCVSSADARALRNLVPDCEPIEVPNGIDLADYVGEIPSLQSPALGASNLDPDDILLFTGKMDYRPNVDAALWFAHEILPRVRRQRRQAQFVIAGQRPHANLVALRRRRGVVVTGLVPDLVPYLAAASVYVAPLRMGGGTRFKLLEAMAMRKAIVSTSLGAEGFNLVDGREARLADKAGEFAAAVIALLGDESKRAALGLAARRFVEAGYNWPAIIPRVEAAYRAA